MPVTITMPIKLYWLKIVFLCKTFVKCGSFTEIGINTSAVEGFHGSPRFSFSFDDFEYLAGFFGRNNLYVIINPFFKQMVIT
jgi:hypothetical protein